VQNFHFRIYRNPVKNQAVRKRNLPRPARERSSPKSRRSRDYAAAGGMPGAFRTGIVKNQQGSASELLQIGRSERQAVLNLSQSRDKLSSEKLARSPRLVIRLRRICAGFAAAKRASPAPNAVLSRDREKSTGFGSGSVANRQQ
jgi:hypothetical protein